MCIKVKFARMKDEIKNPNQVRKIKTIHNIPTIVPMKQNLSMFHTKP